MTAISLDKDKIFRHIAWPTICEMIEQLEKVPEDNEDAVAFRKVLEAYMVKTWPNKYEQYLNHRETMKISPAQRLANDIWSTSIGYKLSLVSRRSSGALLPAIGSCFNPPVDIETKI